MSRTGSNKRRQDASRMTACGVGTFYRVSPTTVGVVVSQSADLARYLGGIPGAKVMPAKASVTKAHVPLIHMPEVAGVLREPSSAEAVTRRRSRIW